MRLEHTEGSSRKFWEATVEGNVLHVRWGRIGAEGQRKSHVLADEPAARAERDKLSREKLRKGYILVTADETPSVASPPAPPSTEEATARSTPAEARARAATLAPPSLREGGVLTWSLFRTAGGAREFFEISVAGREMEIARGKVGKHGRAREITLDPRESIEARVIRELAKALSDGFVPGDEEAPTPDVPEDSGRRRAVAWLRRHARTGYLPIVEAGEGPLDGSRFGGAPALLRDESAPRCGLCRKPLTLILQLAQPSLPAEARRVLPNGLIQLLWCDTICQAEGGWEPFSPANLARAIPMSGPFRRPAPDETAGRAFDPKRVTGWSTIETYPSYSDRRDLDEHRGDELAEAVDELCNEESEGYQNRGGERLLGWAHWIQDVETVTCRTCRARMAPVFQVDTNTTLTGLAFGDSGIGFLMACPACKAMTFVWQSC